LGSFWYGFETKNLVGATGVEEIQKDTNSKIFVGRIFYENQFVEIINLHPYLHIEPSDDQQIIVFKDKNGKLIGLIIDFLGPICEIPKEMISDPKGIFTNKENFIELIAKPPQGINKILSILNPNILIETLVKEVLEYEI
jgi:chemotaxis signal transduction protein